MKKTFLLFTLALAACTHVEHVLAPASAPPAGLIIEDDRINVDAAPRTRSAANAFTFALARDGADNTVVSGLTARRAWLLAALAAPVAARPPLLGALGVPASSNAQRMDAADAIAAEHARLGAPGLTLAAHAWFAPGKMPAPDTRASLAHALGADVDELVPEAGGEAPVNDWIARQTGVGDFVPPLGARTERVLVSTLSFHGAWATPFRPFDTAPKPFALAGAAGADATTARITLPTMVGEGRYPFARSAEASFVALSSAGDETTLLLAVPTRGTLAALEHEMTGGLFERASAGLTIEEGRVELPRFRITSRARTRAEELPPAYRALATLADETAIHEHVAIDVDEEGATATAVAAVVQATIAAPAGAELAPRRMRVFRADRPFLFWLVHVRTGAILVAGRVVDPR